MKVPSSQDIFPNLPRPIVFGHRGASADFPENTITAFQACKDRGIPGIELDVQMCSTGEVVVIHDASLERVTGYAAMVSDTPWSVISKLNAANNRSTAPEQIPLLEDVLEEFGNFFVFDIEIKTTSGKNAGTRLKTLVHKTVNIIRRCDCADRTVISSFNPRALKFAAETAPEIPRALIYSKDPEVPRLLRRGQGRFLVPVSILKPDVDLFSKGAAGQALSSGRYGVLPWTVDSRQTAEEMRDKGIFGIITNTPGRI